MTRQLDVKSRHREQIKRLLREHLPGVEVWAYGSRVTGRSHEGSDLDLVLRGPGLVKIDPSQLAEFNEAVQESTIPFLIEARDWARLPESFHREIEQEHVVLVEREEGAQLFGSLPESWKRMPLGDFVTLQRGHDLPDAIRRPGNRPVLGSFGVTGWHDEARAAGPGVTVGRSGASFGVVRYSPVDYWPLNTALYVVNFHGNDQRFAYYLLKQFDFRTYNSGSAQPSLNRNFIHPIPVNVPPLPEQRAIAHILGTLDDKIELNRCMNETLEEMARALFKSWFVDFDPVHAKATLKHHAANQAPRQGDSAQATEAARSGITPPLRGSRQAKGASPQARRRGEIRRLYSPQTLHKAQALRHNQTDAEGLLWHYLRSKQLGGYKFRRQQPIGPYIADFACLSQKVLIELDGSQHAARQDYDEKRDAFLREKGYRVLRFWNNEVFENCFGVLEGIYAVLHHQPSLEGGSKDVSLSGRGDPPPQQPAPNGLAAATPPQGGSDWTVERARAYLDGMDADITASFPDSFVDSELGPIPAGWEVGALDDVIELHSGGTPKTSIAEYWDGDIPWYTAKDAPSLSDVFILETERSITQAGVENSAAKILPAWTTVITARGTVGRLACLGIPMAMNQTCYGIRGVQDYPDFFTYMNIRMTVDELQQRTHGTIFDTITRQTFKLIDAIIPPPKLADKFETVVQPMMSHILSNLHESRALTALRDTLLPKLVSGELRVKATTKKELLSPCQR